MRIIGIALFALVGTSYVAIFVSADIVFFFLFKACRAGGDLRYWLRLDGALSWIATFIARFLAKVLVDFTTMVQLRHPSELGKK